MDFSRKKLSEIADGDLIQFRIDSIKPFELMMAPVYIFLKENAKFISVKAPLDFFTEKDLERLKSHENLYFPAFINSLEPFTKAGQRVRKILLFGPPRMEDMDEHETPTIDLPPTSYEISDAILQILGPLWWERPGQGPGIEPFLACVFVNGLCDLLDSERLLAARENSVESLDRAVLRSGWAVFLALHLGYCGLRFLNQLRGRVFDENAAGEPKPTPPHETVSGSEIDELVSLSYASFPNIETRVIYGGFYDKRSETVSQKLWGRLERVKRELQSRGKEPPTIVGRKGFTDA